MVDRTTEFNGAVRIFQKAAASANGTPPKEERHTAPPGDFTTAAANVAVGFQGTMKLIERLRKLVGRKGLSNDPTVEIGEVAGFFKGDMATLQTELTALQRSLRPCGDPFRYALPFLVRTLPASTSGRYADGCAAQSPPANTQRQKHCQCVCAALRKTAELQMRAFQEALQQRTAILRQQNERRKHFSHT
ncbi:unnamed protein product, partial [Phaeothamnion confervicola]